MIAYVTVGADDLVRAQRFYDAFLPALGYRLEKVHGDLSYIPQMSAGQSVALPDLYVKAPFDGQSASVGNGSMVAFEAHRQSQVRDLHAAALAAGGSDDGAGHAGRIVDGDLVHPAVHVRSPLGFNRGKVVVVEAEMTQRQNVPAQIRCHRVGTFHGAVPLHGVRDAPLLASEVGVSVGGEDLEDCCE